MLRAVNPPEKKPPKKKKKPPLRKTKTRPASSGAAGVKSSQPGEEKKSSRIVRAFTIVGIGASAGGLEALKDFLRNLPKDSGIGYVVIPHLAPSYKSIMWQLLQKHTEITVVEAEDGMRVRPDCIYVLPAGKEMSILRGRLQLISPAKGQSIRNPIDFFFTSLARDQGEQAIGVILSGTGTDGTRGIREIKSEGGLVVVQEPGNALYSGMPLSAMETGLADYVLTAKKIPKALTEYARHSLSLRLKKGDSGDADLANQLRKIFALIRNEVGIDFSLYKSDHLIRGIQKQMSMHRISNMEDYIRLLRLNTDEVGVLSRTLLINVSRFFRDDFAFEAMKQKALPILANGKDRKSPLRIWVPGCSTGEEPYSLAMLLREYMEEIGRRFAVQIFATDVDSAFVEQARLGQYSSSISEDLTPERLDHFFERTGSGYKVTDDIRSMVIFAPQDLVKGPTFMRLDMISCRNVLIYMGAKLQKQVIPLFHYCLNPGGILFLGSSETIGKFSDLFSAIDHKARIFQAKKVKSPVLPMSMRSIQVPPFGLHDGAGGQGGKEETIGTLFDRAFQALASAPSGNAVADVLREALTKFQPERGGAQEKADQKRVARSPDDKSVSRKEHQKLQEEIRELRERLQTTVEELETSNEELRSSNEELESVNEELLTLNAEFQNKIDELADARTNMDILLSGAQIATVFLSTNLTIRSFTPSITGIINLLPADVGRNLRDFSSYLQYPGMVVDIQQVIETGTPQEHVIVHGDREKWYMVRVLPYRKKGRIDGAAITFIDISEQKAAQRKVQDALTYADGIIETVREPLLVLDADLRVITGNRAFYETFHVAKEETENRLVYELGNRQWDIPELRKLLEDILPSHSRFEHFLVEQEFANIGRKKMLLNARRIMQEGEGTQMILLAIEETKSQ